MAKKIIAVNAGPRKGWNTDTLIDEAIKGAESAGAEVQKFNLFHLEKYTGCISCFGCKKNKYKGNCIRKDGLTEVLDAILQLFPLDTFVEHPVMIMDKPAEQSDLPTPVWKEFSEIVGKYDNRGDSAISYVDRFAFYDLARKSYAVVSTTEHAYYACIILQKGCL